MVARAQSEERDEYLLSQGLASREIHVIFTDAGYAAVKNSLIQRNHSIVAAVAAFTPTNSRRGERCQLALQRSDQPFAGLRRQRNAIFGFNRQHVCPAGVTDTVPALPQRRVGRGKIVQALIVKTLIPPCNQKKSYKYTILGIYGRSCLQDPGRILRGKSPLKFPTGQCSRFSSSLALETRTAGSIQ